MLILDSVTSMHFKLCLLCQLINVTMSLPEEETRKEKRNLGEGNHFYLPQAEATGKSPVMFHRSAGSAVEIVAISLPSCSAL